MRKPSEVVNEAREILAQQFERFKYEPDVAQLNANFRRMTNQFDTPGPRMARTEDFNVEHGDEQIPVRLFVPFGADEEAGPTLVYFHGGGFVTCSTETHEGIIRRIANGAICRVLSVEYRLAPQHPFPAATDDCEHVLNWAMDGQGRETHGIDSRFIAVGGDSAGGNMAAYLAQKYRDRLAAQILLYPLMQLVEFKPPKPGPQDWLQLGFMALRYIDENYVAGADAQDTRLSPLFEKNLDGLPPAYVLTCGLDPLRDEGQLYADNMATHGNRVVYQHEKAMPHGFLNFAKVFPKGRTIPLEAADFLRDHFPTLRNLGQ